MGPVGGTAGHVQAVLEEGLDLNGRDRSIERQDELAVEAHRVGVARGLRLDEDEPESAVDLVDVQRQRVVDRVVDPRQPQGPLVDVLDDERVRVDRGALARRAGLGAEEPAAAIHDVDVDVVARRVVEVDLDRHAVAAVVGRFLAGLLGRGLRRRLRRLLRGLFGGLLGGFVARGRARGRDRRGRRRLAGRRHDAAVTAPAAATDAERDAGDERDRDDGRADDEEGREAGAPQGRGLDAVHRVASVLFVEPAVHRACCGAHKG